jgi:predicted negative regulator of RcsB-dependent stress response
MPIQAIFAVIIILLLSTHAFAQDEKSCQVSDTQCLYSHLQSGIADIEQERWRNAAYRDLAESMAYNGQIDEAVALIQKIDNDDTQAMTVRAIGMVLALHRDLTVEEYQSMFAKLDNAAQTIADEGARDIAYTYIAMAQAFAGLDADATKTTDAMTNPALKHKAFGETAEIQAGKGKFDEAMKSINLIDSVAFKNKALGIVSDIFVKNGDLDSALKVTQQITNPTRKATSMQNIINYQIGLEQVND